MDERPNAPNAPMIGGSASPLSSSTAAPSEAEPGRVSLRDLMEHLAARPVEMTPAAEPPRGRYRRQGALGQGGMGEVFAAEDRALGRTVAVKVMRPENRRDPALVARFVEEARVTAQLEHPGIVPVYDLAMLADGSLCYTMKRIQGESLADILDRLHGGDPDTRAQFPLSRRLRLFAQVCQAVAFAHSLGVVHRDLKPENVVVGRFGEIMVLDWGVAKLLGASSVALQPMEHGPSAATREGAVLGTWFFMAPEQARGEVSRLGPQADVFSLGAVLYCLLSPQPPYAGLRPDEVPHAVSHGAYCPLDKSAPGTPADLAALVHKAMDPEPAGRYANAGELAEDVQRFLDDQPLRGVRTSWRRRVQKWVRKNPTATGAALGVALVALIALVRAGAAAIQEAGRDRRLQALAGQIKDQNARSRQALFALREREVAAVGLEKSEIAARLRDLRREIETRHHVLAGAYWAAVVAGGDADQEARRRLIEDYMNHVEFCLDLGDVETAAALASVFTLRVRGEPLFPRIPDQRRLEGIYRRLGGPPKPVEVGPGAD